MSEMASLQFQEDHRQARMQVEEAERAMSNAQWDLKQLSKFRVPGTKAKKKEALEEAQERLEEVRRNYLKRFEMVDAEEAAAEANSSGEEYSPADAKVAVKAAAQKAAAEKVLAAEAAMQGVAEETEAAQQAAAEKATASEKTAAAEAALQNAPAQKPASEEAAVTETATERTAAETEAAEQAPAEKAASEEVAAAEAATQEAAAESRSAPASLKGAWLGNELRNKDAAIAEAMQLCRKAEEQASIFRRKHEESERQLQLQAAAAAEGEAAIKTAEERAEEEAERAAADVEDNGDSEMAPSEEDGAAEVTKPAADREEVWLADISSTAPTTPERTLAAGDEETDSEASNSDGSSYGDEEPLDYFIMDVAAKLPDADATKLMERISRHERHMARVEQRLRRRYERRATAPATISEPSMTATLSSESEPVEAKAANLRSQRATQPASTLEVASAIMEVASASVYKEPKPEEKSEGVRSSEKNESEWDTTGSDSGPDQTQVVPSSPPFSRTLSRSRIIVLTSGAVLILGAVLPFFLDAGTE